MSIKQLREMTGAGLMDCKKALEAAGNDIEKALVILKEKGIAKAQKRSNNLANEGAIFIVESDTSYVMLNIGTETDFVAKNDHFCSEILKEAVKFAKNNQNDILNEEFNQQLAMLSATMGENILLKDAFKFVKSSQAIVETYIHNHLNANFLNIGKIGVVVAANLDIDREILKNIALHIASFKPNSIEELNEQCYLMDNKLTVAKFCQIHSINIADFRVFSI